MKPLTLSEFINKLSIIKFDDNNDDNTIKNRLIDIFSDKYFDESAFHEFITLTNDQLNIKLNKLNNDYDELVGSISKAEKISIDKNKEQIEKYISDANFSILDLKQEFNEKKSNYNNALVILKETNLKNNIDNLKIYEEETRHINIEIDEINTKSNIQIQKIEHERKNKILSLDDEFDDNIESLKEKIELLKINNKNEIDVLKNNLKDELENKDNNYLSIKQTHTLSSVKLNTFINKIKDDSKQVDIENINSTDQIIKELDQKIVEEKDNHLKINNDIQEKFLEKTKALNIVFDVQKDSYNKNTDEIISLNNEEVTNINQKNRLVMEQIKLKITNLEKEKRTNQLKATTSDEKNKINKDYNKRVNKLKQELISLNYKNTIDLNKQELKFQSDLFDHDFSHVKQINEWRFTKNIYDSERKRLVNDEILRYNHEIFKLEKEKIKYIDILDVNHDIQKINLDKDLLPIESQLFFTSLLQNREINLLNLEFESTKLNNQYQQNLLVNNLYLEELKLKNEIQLLNSSKNYKNKLISVEYQLEVEKEILKRNHKVNILKLNLELQDKLLDQKNGILDQQLEYSSKNASFKIEQSRVELEYNTSQFNKISTIEKQKRNAIIDEITIRNKFTTSKSVIQKTIQSLKLFTESRERINKEYFELYLNLYQNEEELFKVLIDLIKLPAHPEKIRNLNNLLASVLDEFNNVINIIINYYIENDITTSNQKFEELIDYKYNLKNTKIQTSFNNNIELIEQKKDEIIKKIDLINEENVIISNKLKQHNLLLQFYMKKTPDQNIDNKSEILNLNNDINDLKFKFRANEKIISKHKSDLLPFNNSYTRFEKTRKLSESRLNKQISVERNNNLNLLIKYKKITVKLKKLVNSHTSQLHTIYNSLNDNTYLNDQKILYFETKLKKIYTDFYKKSFQLNTELLNYWLNTYLLNREEQQLFMKDFESSTELALNQINRTYKKFINFENNEKIILEKDYNETNKKINESISSLKIKNDFNHNNIIQKYKTDYKNTEATILNNNNKIAKDLVLISENLADVLNNLSQKNDIQLDKERKLYKKEYDSIQNKINSINNDIKNNYSKSNIKTNYLINKYENERKAHLKLMNNKRDKYTTSIDKLFLNIENIKKNYNFDVKFDLEKMKKLQKNELLIQRNEISKNKSDKNKLTKKERKSLKKSYNFKYKQIKAKLN